MKPAHPPVAIGGLIGRNPGIKNGSPHIAGRGILVRTIARWDRTGLSPEEITAKYRSLRLEQVHAALAYYYANRREIDLELEQVDREADKLEVAWETIPLDATTQAAMDEVASLWVQKRKRS
jgi:uncharacterized protein (DUF433 family)